MKKVYLSLLIIPFMLSCGDGDSKDGKDKNGKGSSADMSPSVLNAFVNIEESIQIGNVTEQQSGTAQILGVKEKLVNDEGYKSARASAVYDAMLDIDKFTAEKIQLIDKVKLLLLHASGEYLDPKAQEPICVLAKGQVLNFTDKKNMGLTRDSRDAIVPFVQPIRMNLQNVIKKDAKDKVKSILGSKKAPGYVVFPALKDFRKKLPDVLVKVSNQLAKIDSMNRSFKYKDPNINRYKDINDLRKKLDEALKSIGYQDPSLAYEIKKIYQGLTKNEIALKAVFHEVPLVAAMGTLSSFQRQILAARADALRYLGGLVGGSSYSFNTVEGRAFAPTYASVGEKVKMEVMMVAYDTEKQPIVEPDQGIVVGEPRNGKAIVEFTASSSGKMILTGKLAIKDKNGVPKWANYETTIWIK